jgi:hypothetical protein
VFDVGPLFIKTGSTSHSRHPSPTSDLNIFREEEEEKQNTKSRLRRNENAGLIESTALDPDERKLAHDANQVNASSSATILQQPHSDRGTKIGSVAVPAVAAVAAGGEGNDSRAAQQW